MKIKENAVKVSWALLGMFFPAGQAIWANIYIKKNHPELIATSDLEDTKEKWLTQITHPNKSSSLILNIYEHESARRAVLTSKAQASLAIASLMLTALSFLAPMVTSDDRLGLYLPTWAIFCVATYMLSAITCAFYALHVEKYIVVELAELKKLMDETKERGEEFLEKEFSAYQAAAIELNSSITLCVANLIDAAFSSLRNSVFFLVGVPLVICAWKFISAHFVCSNF